MMWCCVKSGLFLVGWVWIAIVEMLLFLVVPGGMVSAQTTSFAALLKTITSFLGRVLKGC